MRLKGSYHSCLIEPAFFYQQGRYNLIYFTMCCKHSLHIIFYDETLM